MNIRPRTPDDDQHILRIYNRLHHDAAPVTVEEFRGLIARRPEGTGLAQWVAEEEGQVVGSLELWEMWELSRPGAWQLFLEVDDGHQRRGVGGALYEFLMARVGELDVQRLYGNVREDRPESLAFAERRGFHPTGLVERYSRLKVDEARLDGLEGTEEELEGQGIEIRTLAEIGLEDAAFLRALHAMSEGSMRDVPMPEPFEPRPFEYWVRNTLLFPGNSPDHCWVALAGECPVGIARLRRQSDNSFFNAYTGVDREYRGRGIARALKLRTVRWAQEQGAPYLYTGNDAENTRMLEINLRLGYRPLPGSIEVLKQLAPSNPPSS